MSVSKWQVELWFDAKKENIMESVRLSGSEVPPYIQEQQARVWVPVDQLTKKNMVVSREFMQRWTKEFSGFTASYYVEILLERMLRELDHEIEEEK